MLSNKEVLRFSGHDTFHCKEQWILKGLQLVEYHGDTDVFKTTDAIPSLGVGKNMVRSIQHWLAAFGLLNENKPSSFAELLFLKEKIDPYLEDEGSLWLLQYFICKSQYASIFKLIFADYFSDKATQEFSESQIFRFINKELKLKEQKPIADKTLETDFKVFIRSYLSPVKNHKTVEDDFNVPFIPLNLVLNTGRKNEKGQTVYRINKGDHSIPIEVVIFCLLTEFDGEVAVNFDDIRKTIGSYLCLSNDKLDEILTDISNKHHAFVYKEDAGIRQIQIKENRTGLKNDILKKYYELHN